MSAGDRPTFRAIPRLPRANYMIHVDWHDLERQLAHQAELGLDLDPDFQRGHVWTPAQQTAYVEHVLVGGESGRDLLFNCVGWMDRFEGPYVIVDGKQRLAAARGFLRGEVRAFGRAFGEYGDSLPRDVGFRWHVAALRTHAEVLAWYLALNSGGTPHTDAELGRVRALLDAERTLELHRAARAAAEPPAGAPRGRARRDP